MVGKFSIWARTLCCLIFTVYIFTVLVGIALHIALQVFLFDWHSGNEIKKSFESLKLCRWINLKNLEIILKLPISKRKLFCYSVCRYLLRRTQEEEGVVEDRWFSAFNTTASAAVGKTNTCSTYTIHSIWTYDKN